MLSKFWLCLPIPPPAVMTIRSISTSHELSDLNSPTCQSKFGYRLCFLVIYMYELSDLSGSERVKETFHAVTRAVFPFVSIDLRDLCVSNENCKICCCCCCWRHLVRLHVQHHHWLSMSPFSDYGQWCVPTSIALVCRHTQSAAKVRQTHIAKSVFMKSCLEAQGSTETKLSPRSHACRKILELQRGRSTDLQLHQCHQARCLRTILERRRSRRYRYIKGRASVCMSVCLSVLPDITVMVDCV